MPAFNRPWETNNNDDLAGIDGSNRALHDMLETLRKENEEAAKKKRESLVEFLARLALNDAHVGAQRRARVVDLCL